MVVRTQSRSWIPALVAGFLLCLGLGCGTLGEPGAVALRFDYFERPSTDDVWSAKIEGWQRRERFDAALVEPLSLARAVETAGAFGDRATADEPAATELRSKYFAFRADRKRALAREVARWIQTEAKDHYFEDGAVDHWATLEETLARGGDDCDGLELLAFHALRDLGFSENEVYRAIVVRPSDGQHHMVTLWFEDAYDPWVVDPTGAMTVGMPRMSSLEEWVPLKLFSETREYSVGDPREHLLPGSSSLAQTP